MQTTQLKHCGMGVLGRVLSVSRPAISCGSNNGWRQFKADTNTIVITIEPKRNKMTQIGQIARSKNRHSFAVLFPDGDEYKFRGVVFAKKHSKKTTVPNRLDIVVTRIDIANSTFTTIQQSAAKMF